MNTIESRYRTFVKEFDLSLEAYIKRFDDVPRFQETLKRLAYPLTLLEWIEQIELPKAKKEENYEYCKELIEKSNVYKKE